VTCVAHVGVKGQGSFTPAVRKIADHCLASSSRAAANSAGDDSGISRQPNRAYVARSSGCCSARVASRWRRLTISAGVPAGATRPSQVSPGILGPAPRRRSEHSAAAVRAGSWNGSLHSSRPRRRPGCHAGRSARCAGGPKLRIAGPHACIRLHPRWPAAMSETGHSVANGSRTRTAIGSPVALRAIRSLRQRVPGYRRT
jgi:hypothetical protein